MNGNYAVTVAVNGAAVYAAAHIGHTPKRVTAFALAACTSGSASMARKNVGDLVCIQTHGLGPAERMHDIRRVFRVEADPSALLRPNWRRNRLVEVK